MAEEMGNFQPPLPEGTPPPLQQSAMSVSPLPNPLADVQVPDVNARRECWSSWQSYGTAGAIGQHMHLCLMSLHPTSCWQGVQEQVLAVYQAQ